MPMPLKVRYYKEAPQQARGPNRAMDSHATLDSINSHIRASAPRQRQHAATRPARVG